MSEPLFRLVYRSRPSLEGGEAEQRRHLDRILAASRRRNPELKLSGALMLRDGVFIQVLEGPLPAVENLFELICRDERHQAVTLLELTPIDARSFGDWSMAWISGEGAALHHRVLEADDQQLANRNEVAAFLEAMQAALAPAAGTGTAAH